MSQFNEVDSFPVHSYQFLKILSFLGRGGGGGGGDVLCMCIVSLNIVSRSKPLPSAALDVLHHQHGLVLETNVQYHVRVYIMTYI